MSDGARRVLVVAGEASGDQHAAEVVAALRRLAPDLRFVGIGGPSLRAAGVEILVDAEEIAVIGIVEVLGHLRAIVGAYRRLRRLIRDAPPDLVLLVDYVEFNLRIAAVAKRAGVKVLYYISPQIWAWRAGRVRTIGRRVDHMAVLFPFEAPFYEKAGVPATFVGHPLARKARSDLTPEDARRRFGLDPVRPTIGLFPGSRRGEVRRLLPVMAAAAARLLGDHGDAQFVLGLAPTIGAAAVAPLLGDMGDRIAVVGEDRYDLMRACDAMAAASGTVTLEAALIGTPMVIVYKVAPLTYMLGKRLIRIDNIGLANIVAGRRIVRELIQHDAEPVALADALARLLGGDHAREVRHGLAGVRAALGGGGGAEEVARIALGLMASAPP